MPGYALRNLFPYPLSPRFIGCCMARMDRNVTVRITTGAVLPGSRCTLTLCFDKEADAEQLKDLPVRINTKPAHSSGASTSTSTASTSRSLT